MPEPCTTISSRPAVSPTVDPAWDEAFVRVESYLRAHQLESRIQLNELATEIIVEAQAEAAGSSTEAPVTLAMRVTHARIGQWFARAAPQSDWSNDRDRARGRLALVIAHLPDRWSDQFLSNEPVSPEVIAALAAFQFQPGPELRFSNMPPAPLEFGFDDTHNPQAVRHGVWLLVRAASSWLIVVGLIGAAWAASH
jgi:hypothetical protein